MRIGILDRDPNQLAQLASMLRAKVVSDTPVICETFLDGGDLQQILYRESFDLLILEWLVPQGSGPGIVEWLRSSRKDSTPVVAIGSRPSELDLAQALDWGADDYISKPARLSEVRARVQRLANRLLRTGAGNLVRVGPWEFDRVSHCAAVRSETGTALLQERHQLTPPEFEIALALFKNIGRILSRSHLLECAGSDTTEISSRTLDSHIYRLRHKLRLKMEHGLSLRTVYGRGYRLDASFCSGPELMKLQ